MTKLNENTYWNKVRVSIELVRLKIFDLEKQSKNKLLETERFVNQFKEIPQNELVFYKKSICHRLKDMNIIMTESALNTFLESGNSSIAEEVMEIMKDLLQNVITIKVCECVMRDIIAIYNLNIDDVDFFVEKSKNAIQRITLQIGSSTCSHQIKPFLLYDDDREAIRRLLNNYCLFIAERHDKIMCKAFKDIAFMQYEKYSKMMKLFY